MAQVRRFLSLLENLLARVWTLLKRGYAMKTGFGDFEGIAADREWRATLIDRSIALSGNWAVPSSSAKRSADLSETYIDVCDGEDPIQCRRAYD